MQSITVFTDGGNRNHGNKKGQHVKATDPSAWAYLIKLKGTNIEKSDGIIGTTNNQMELTAVFEALTYLYKHQLMHESIELVSDSKYFLDAINQGWLDNWKTRGWTNAQHKAIKNQTLWKNIDYLLNQFTDLELAWTKGHADNDGNNRVDYLLNQTMNEQVKQMEQSRKDD